MMQYGPNVLYIRRYKVLIRCNVNNGHTKKTTR